MSTTVSDDDIFNALEAQIMDWETVEVQFSRIAFARFGVGWQVAFKLEGSDGNGRSTSATGGGNTLREALINAFANRAIRRLPPAAEPVDQFTLS